MSDLALDHWYEAQVRRDSFWDRLGPKASEISRVRSFIEMWPSKDALNIIRGSLDFLARDMSSSYMHYSKAAYLGVQGRVFIDQASWGCHTVCSPWDVIEAGKYEQPNVDYVVDPDSSSPCYVITCDEIYFVAFAKSMAESVAKFSPESQLHFHVINPTSVARSIYAELSVSCSSRLSFSTESVNPSDVADLRAFYTCVRFLRARQFMKRWATPLLFIDADGVVTGDLMKECIQAMPEGADIGLRLFSRFPSFHPWRRVSANCLLVRPGRLSEIFFETFERLFSIKFDRKSGKNWWIDQNLLDASLRFCSENDWFIYGKLGPASARSLSLLHSKGRILDEARLIIRRNSLGS